MQGTYAILVGTVTVLIILVLIAMIARQYRESGGIDSIAKILPAFFVVIVAVIILGQIADIGQDEEPEPEPGHVSYSFDASTGTLTISSDVPDGYIGPWDSYSENVKNLIITDAASSIGAWTLSSLTALESLTMPNDVTFGSNALGVELKDVFGESTEAGGEYASSGNGVMYLSNPEVFTYSEDGTSITGLSDIGKTAMVLVIPGTVGGTAVTSIADGTSSDAIMKDGVYTIVLHTADPKLVTIGSYAFDYSTTLATVDIPSSVTDIKRNAFSHCSSLATVDIPSSVASIGRSAFSVCSSLATVDIPSSVASIGSYAFYYCSSLATVDIPSSVASISENAFGYCTGTTQVSFESGFGANLNASWANSWTFYESDGTTVIDKTVAANLAGKTFQGTAAALVEVLPERTTLTPDQILKVRLHDTELQDLKDRIALDPLPLRPSLEEELTA